MADNNRPFKIGAFWLYEKDDGSKYLSGRLDIPAGITLDSDTRLLLFRSKSEHEKAPYFDFCIAKDDRDRSRNQGGGKQGGGIDDDIPF